MQLPLYSTCNNPQVHDKYLEESTPPEPATPLELEASLAITGTQLSATPPELEDPLSSRSTQLELPWYLSCYA